MYKDRSLESDFINIMIITTIIEVYVHVVYKLTAPRSYFFGHHNHLHLHFDFHLRICRATNDPRITKIRLWAYV